MMAHRPKHRHSALLHRLDRMAAGTPANPSHRDAKPKTGLQCPCGKIFRRDFQLRLHVVLDH